VITNPVHVPGCPSDIKFYPLEFTNAVSNVWYDLKDPLTLSATYSRREFNPSQGNYGREHIYEVHLRQYYCISNYSLLTPFMTVAHFIGSIRNIKKIWNFEQFEGKFCNWVETHLIKPYIKDNSVRSDRVLPS
jgi:hypothetical protein